MLRAIGGVVVGYIAMFAVVFCVLTGAYLAMGADGAFKSGTYDVSPAWIAIWAVTTLVAAVVGGLVCVLIARSDKPAMVLAAIVLVLGLAMAGLSLSGNKPDPGPRTADVKNLEAMTKAKEPSWMAIANPIIGAAGVMIGARVCGRKAKAPEAT